MKTDFLVSMNRLWGMSFSFRTYKKVPLVAAIFAGIILWPVLLLSLLFSLVYYCNAIFLKICTIPLEYLTNLLHDEGKDVKHATQAVIYLIGFPLVFLMNVVRSFLTISLVIQYAIISFLNYLWTLKGFEFHPYLPEGGCVELPDTPVQTSEKLKVLIISAAVLALALVFGLTGGLSFLVDEWTVGYICLYTASAFIPLSYILYLAILDKKRLVIQE